MDVPSAIFFVLLLGCLLERGPAMLYLFFGGWAFASVAAVPPALIGGITLTPAWITACALIGKVAWRHGPREVADSLMNPKRVGLLTLCAVYSAIITLFAPRIMAGQIEVIPLRITILHHTAEPLGPVASNLTQGFYLLVTVGLISALEITCRRGDGRRQVLNAFLFGGAVCAMTGLVDWLTGLAGATALLEPLRTASYSLMTEAEAFAGSGRRVIGLTPEASSFSQFAIGFAAPLLFLRSAYQRPTTRNVTVPLTVTGLLFFTWLSKSSTGIVGIAVLAAVIAVHAMRASLLGRREGRQGLALVYGGTVVLMLAFLFPAVSGDAMHVVDMMIFKKTATSSFEERSMWNAVTLDAFRQSWGFGVGVGSDRASSWPIAVLGNIGVPGAVLMFGYLLRVLLARSRSEDVGFDRVFIGAKYGLLPSLVMGAMVGTSVAFSLPLTCLAAIVTGMSNLPQRVPQQRRRRYHGMEVAPPKGLAS